MEGNIFNRPPQDTDLAKEYADMKRLDLHNANLYDEEGTAHGGEKINPETGRPNVNFDGEPADDGIVSEREVALGNKDIMGDMPDPSKMSLEELLATQDEE